LATSFTEAALTTHKLAREAAVPDGVLPRLSPKGRSNMAISLRTTLQGFSPDSRPSLVPFVSQAALEKFMPELESEPSIFRVVKKLAEHRIDRGTYYAGAAMVVAGLRLARSEQA